MAKGSIYKSNPRQLGPSKTCTPLVTPLVGLRLVLLNLHNASVTQADLQRAKHTTHRYRARVPLGSDATVYVSPDSFCKFR